MSTDRVPSHVAPGEGAAGSADADRVDASVTVRLGLVDTTYPQHGELHVLGRMALRSVDGFAVESGLTVGTVTTRFDLAGSAGEVLGALDALAAWICDPSWSGIDDVVAAARRDRAEGVDAELAQAALGRWGREGVGLLACAPHCGYAAEVDRLDRWRTRFLTAGNVVLSGAGAGLEEADLQLPAGERIGVPEARGPSASVPSWRSAPGLEVPLLSTLTGDPAATRALSVLLTRGGNDGPGSGTVRGATRTRALPVGEGLLWLYTHRTAPADLLVGALDRIAEGEAGDEEVAEALAGPVREPGARARAESEALAALLGTPPARSVSEVTPDELVDEARRARSQLLLLADGDPGVDDLAESGPADLPEAGRVLHHYHGRGSSEQLVMTARTCERRNGGDRVAGLAWEQLVGVHRAEHVRRLVPRDGDELWIDGHDWRHDRHALAMADGHVADEVVIHDPDLEDVGHADRRPWRDLPLAIPLAVALLVLVALVVAGVLIAT